MAHPWVFYAQRAFKFKVSNRKSLQKSQHHLLQLFLQIWKRMRDRESKTKCLYIICKHFTFSITIAALSNSICACTHCRYKRKSRLQIVFDYAPATTGRLKAHVQFVYYYPLPIVSFSVNLTSKILACICARLLIFYLFLFPL